MSESKIADASNYPTVLALCAGNVRKLNEELVTARLLRAQLEATKSYWRDQSYDAIAKQLDVAGFVANCQRASDGSTCRWRVAVEFKDPPFNLTGVTVQVNFDRDEWYVERDGRAHDTFFYHKGIVEDVLNAVQAVLNDIAIEVETHIKDQNRMNQKLESELHDIESVG